MSDETSNKTAAIPTSGEITGIRPLKRDPNLLGVAVDGKRIAALSPAEVEELNLREDSPWTPELATRLGTLLAMQKVRRQALRMLSKRALSRQELSDRLRKREHAGHLVDSVVNELESQNWLDDNTLAEQVVEHVARQGPAGEQLLEEQLRKRGVDTGVAADAIAQHRNEHGELTQEESITFARKRLARFAELPPETRLRRLSNVLGRRGLDEDHVRDVLAALADEIGIDINEVPTQ